MSVNGEYTITVNLQIRLALRVLLSPDIGRTTYILQSGLMHHS